MFAVFDGSKSEDDILQIISNGKYSGVCLARLEVSVQWCTLLLSWHSLYQPTEGKVNCAC